MTTVHRAGTASAAVLSGLVLTLGLAHTAAPQWTQRAGLNLWNVPDYQNTIRENQRELEVLQNQEVRLCQEIEVLDHIASRLAAGTLSLGRLATESAEPILRNRSECEATFMTIYQTTTFHLATARHLIARVERTLRTDPSQWAPASMRLEAEYASMK